MVEVVGDAQPHGRVLGLCVFDVRGRRGAVVEFPVAVEVPGEMEVVAGVGVEVAEASKLTVSGGGPKVLSTLN